MHVGLLNQPQQYQPLNKQHARWNNTSHSINNMHGGLLNLPQQYQPLYKQHAWWIS